jgi:hypothetical protein
MSPASRMAFVAMVIISPVARAQMPGAPVLQNAWAAPGIVVAGNFAGGSGTSVYGGAAAWAPASGRFQLSAGAGAQTSTGGGGRVVYGARVALPVMQLMAGKLGVAAFAGIGGGPEKGSDTTRSNSVIPAGVAVGYRQAIGTAGRGISAYVDPNYQHHKGVAGSQGYFRLGAGLDAGISPRFGVTFGFETGAGAKTGKVGPQGTSYGVGVSMKLGR